MRSVSLLTECDGIICEDTRVTGQLLKLLDIPKKELISYHSHSSDSKLEACIARLLKGEHLALVSDAGTPGISDPGYRVVSRCRLENIEVQALPGPSAFLTALSISGFPINQFVYMGFPPLKKGRQTFWNELSCEHKTIVLYESVHRIQKTCSEIQEAFKNEPNRRIMIARELTKMHEECIFSDISNLDVLSKELTLKGEFVVVISASERKNSKS